jgi:hypothetical protein
MEDPLVDRGWEEGKREEGIGDRGLEIEFQLREGMICL